MIRYLALNKWMPFKKWRYSAIPSITAWFDSRTFQSHFTGPVRMFYRCDKCGRRAWAEEVIGNCGWCARCFDTSYAAYLKEHPEG